MNSKAKKLINEPEWNIDTCKNQYSIKLGRYMLRNWIGKPFMEERIIFLENEVFNFSNHNFRTRLMSKS